MKRKRLKDYLKETDVVKLRNIACKQRWAAFVEPKGEIVDRLCDIIVEKFILHLPYMTANQIAFLNSNAKTIRSTFDGQVFSEQVDKQMFLDYGYAFRNVTGDVEIPSDLLLIYLDLVYEEDFDTGKYLKLRKLLKSVVNFYGAGTYELVVEFFKHFYALPLTVYELINYMSEYNWYHYDIGNDAEAQLVYHTSLSWEDTKLFFPVEPGDDGKGFSMLEVEFFIPPEDVLEYYHKSLIHPKAQKLVDDLKNHIVEKGYFRDVIRDDNDKLQLNENDADYEKTITDLIIASKMGKGIYGALEALEDNLFYFLKSPDLNHFFCLFSRMDFILRKWIMRGYTALEIK